MHAGGLIKESDDTLHETSGWVFAGSNASHPDFRFDWKIEEHELAEDRYCGNRQLGG